MKIGVYVRPWNEEFYTKLARDTFENSEVVKLSEFRNIGDIWLGEALYSEKEIYYIFSNQEMVDIYLRCRFLRSLDMNKAFSLINKMSSYIISIFNNYKFDYFLGHLIDNYTLDIIERISKKYGIRYISLVGHFINGYCRVSSRGELIKIRDNVSKEEIIKALDNLIDTNYKPSFDLNRKKTRIEGVKYYYRDKVKQLYFEILKTINKDKMNYHYNTVGFKNIKLKEIFNRNLENVFCKLEDLNLNENSVYLPLHYTPEATVDYWCDLPTHSLYKNSLIDLISNSSSEINFILKEHPAMYLKRELKFYLELLSFENVKIVHPYENSNLLLEKIENVFVYTGSVGVEALIRNKRVFSITKNYYSDLHPNIKIVQMLTLDDLRKEIVVYDNKLFIRELLEGLIPAKFINSKNIMNSDLKILASYLSRILH